MKVVVNGNIIDRDLLSYPVCHLTDVASDHNKEYLSLQVDDGSKTDDLLNGYASTGDAFSIEFEGVSFMVRCKNKSVPHHSGHFYGLYRSV